MYKKFIAAVLLVVCSTAAANAGGVTNVKEIINNTSMIITVSKSEPKNGNPYSIDYTYEMPAKGGTWSGDMWIPWVNNERDSRDRRMEIGYFTGEDNNKTFHSIFYIWQTGDYVRYSKELYVENAPKVPGESKSGGERRLIIGEKDKKFFIKFEKL